MNKKIKLVISGPPASCKSYFVNLLIERNPEITKILQVTDRKPRKNEKNGVDYYFVDNILGSDKKDFVEVRKFESTGKTYGTLNSDFEMGNILDIHASQCLELSEKGYNFVSLYLTSDYSTLLKRFIERHKDNDFNKAKNEFESRMRLEENALTTYDFDIVYKAKGLLFEDENYSDLIDMINLKLYHKLGASYPYLK